MYERTFKMALRKNKVAPAREACIDDSALNLLVVIVAVILLFSIMLSVYFTVALISRKETPEASEPDDTPVSEEGEYPFRVEGINVDFPAIGDSKNTIPDELINSEYALLVDVTANEIVASRKGSQLIYPASMTKVMTLIVIAENLKSEAELDKVLTIEHERGSNSGYGFNVGEKLTVKDLIYAAILQSDGVACLTLADYIAGSEANFVKLMNAKAAELGIGDTTLFQNCTGLHHQYHYSTCRDVAIMMAYAMQNPLCTSVLTSLKYNPSGNFRPNDGCTFWHTFLHNQLSDGNIQPKKADIIGGKTGLTEKETSGYCVVAYAKGDNGHYYVSVTAKAGGWSANVDDILNIFNEYVE